MADADPHPDEVVAEMRADRPQPVVARIAAAEGEGEEASEG
jgi:hypothetical protein